MASKSKYWSTSVVLRSKLPINFHLAKAYIMANVPFNVTDWNRVYRLGKRIIVARVTQKEPLSNEVSVTVEARRKMSKANVLKIIEKINFEIGLNETMEVLSEQRKNDIHIDLAIKNNPGFRLFANADIIETAICCFLFQNMDILDYVKVVKEFVKKFGEPVSWDSDLYGFPTAETIANMTNEDWEQLNLGYKTPYLANLDRKSLEEIEIYAYYPIYERGLLGLQKIEGIGSFTSRAIMIYGVRRYEKAFHDGIVQDILDRKYNLHQILPPTEFDKWVEQRWPKDPALVLHAHLQEYLPAYIRDFDLSQLG